MTRTGLALGTPLYMSPEQAAGDPDVDGRSDLYSLACLLFEMLAGEPPFSGPTVEAILVQRFTRPPPPRLSARAVGMPASVDAALARAMARDPADRFPTVTRFVEALVPSAPRGREASEKSIAVLPFTNMSAAEEDEYFGDGMTEEIINALTQLEGLRVAARTSSFAFKGKNEDLRLVGEKLNVTTVLEGSVRKAGNRLRITAQLVDVRDGYHLWSERYDRELTDVFAIQDEIATAIASKLKVALTGETEKQLVRPGTSNLEAYELFLKGRAILYRRGPTLVQVAEYFEQALALDPDFPEALAFLADTYRLLGLYGLRRSEETMPRAKAAAQRALALDPSLAEAYATLADVALTYDYDVATATKAWERALALNPAHTRARCECALWRCLVGKPTADAVVETREAVRSDPLSAWAAAVNGLVLSMDGQHRAAVVEAARGVDLDPESFTARYVYPVTLLNAGDAPGAIAAAQSALRMSGRHPWLLVTLAAAQQRAGNREVPEAVYAELLARARSEYVQSFALAGGAATAGRMDEALEWARRAVDERDPMIPFWRFLPEWEPRRAHPGFGALMRRPGLG